MRTSSSSSVNFHGGGMLIKIRLIGRFILWCLSGLVSRTVGSKSFIGGYWRFTKIAFEDGDLPELFFVLLLAPLASVSITVGVMLGSDYPHDQIDRPALIALYSNILWVAAAGVSVLWDRFMYEYETSFRLLKEFDKDNRESN